MITLMTTLYDIKDPARLAEIRECFERNLANPLVRHLIVFTEGVPNTPAYAFLLFPKVVLVPIDERPTYRDFFSMANSSFGERVVVVHNSDVYFDHTLVEAEKAQSEDFWCLCRYNRIYSGPNAGKHQLEQKGCEGSADAWIFRVPLRPFKDDILLGVNGCDSYLAQHAEAAGLVVKNPCLSIIMRHVHASHEGNREPGGFRYWDVSDYKHHILLPVSL
jgi:hypothetical protein